MNLFATVLTYPAPSANYRGESELNRTVIQKISDGRFDYPIISPEAMRNALRETLKRYGLPTNRERIHPDASQDKQQLAVKYKEYPDPEKFVDDFFFGYLLAIKADDIKKLRTARSNHFPLKRDSVLRMNLAKALTPYRHDTVFTQSPQFVKENAWKVGGGDGTSSALLHRETALTAFQYPFALNLEDCKQGPPEWTKKLLQAIGELNGVSGNHARSYYEMAPASILVRLTPSLVAGYPTYGFRITEARDGTPQITFDAVVNGLVNEPPDWPPQEFYLGGEIVRQMNSELADKLRSLKVTLDRSPQRLLETVAQKAFA